MDKFNKLNFFLLGFLILVTVGMLIQHYQQAERNSMPEVDREALLKQYQKRIAKNNILYRDVYELQKTGRYHEAMTKLDGLAKVHPNNFFSYVVKAKILTELGELAAALQAYRTAIEREPDFADKKTPLFIGEPVMKLITEARGKLNREKKLKPKDKTIKNALNNIYYLQRRIAGGCE